jgi:hypothetical protein
MDIVNVLMTDRPSGQPASEESVERERLLASKAEVVAKLKALRVASKASVSSAVDVAPVTKPNRGRKPKIQNSLEDVKDAPVKKGRKKKSTIQN